MAISNSETNLLGALLPEWHLLLQEWSASGRLTAAAQEALILDGTPDALQDLITQWSAGDFGSLPPIVLLSYAEMNGAMGAYAISTGTIYLNAEWLAIATQDQVNAVLTEELGHHLDGLLNASDTPGDEGEYFARLLSGEVLSDAQKDPLSEQIDSGTITAGASNIDAEYATGGWLSYVGSSANDYRGGDVGYFSNGDLATAITIENANGTRQILVSRISETGQTIWSKAFNADYAPFAGDIAIDSSDNIFISGSTKIGASGRSGMNDSDIFLLKVDGLGNQLWYNNYGTTIHEIGASLEIDTTGSVYLNGRVSEANDALQTIANVTNWQGTGYSSGWSGFQMKIASGDGTLQKVYATGSFNSGGELLGLDKSRNRSYVGGYTFGSVNGVATVGNGDSSGANDYLIARDEGTGSVIWTLMKNDIASTIAVDEAKDSIYVVNKGALERINGSTGALIWSKSIVSAGNYAYLAVGQDANLYGTWKTSTNSATIVRFAADGTAEWSIAIASTSSLSLPVISADANALLYIHGNSAGEISIDGVSLSSGIRPGSEDSFLISVITPTTISNSAPTDLTLTSSGINENSAAGTVIGILGATDSDAGSSFTYALVAGTGGNDADNNLVEIVGDQVRVKSGASIDFETNPTLNLNIQVTDNGGLTLAKAFEVAVLDINEFKIETLTRDDASIYITGTAGTAGNSKIESYSVVRTVTGTGRNKITIDTPTYTPLATYTNPSVDGITYSGGASANTISAAGVTGDPLRPAFNGQTILDGKLGTDTITGGSYRNWLVGGGIFSAPLSTATTAVDTLIGTTGATDVFDLRTSNFSADAYSALNTGSAQINNYTKAEDWIVLAGSQGSYSFTTVQTTTGTKKNKITTTTGYKIFNGSELVATVNSASGTSLTGNAANDLQILYGQTGDPTNTIFGGQQMFFG